MRDGTERRKKIEEVLRKACEPVSASALAREFGVSRQVIVQDVALLRATNRNILSTNKGYVLLEKQQHAKCRRVFCVKHSDEQMQEELYSIVDAGARVLDVMIEHGVYGQLSADLMIFSRRDVDEFIKKISADSTKPLKELTGDEHFHTVEADEEEILDEVEASLRKKGYLLDFS